jgi:hypothetical protein
VVQREFISALSANTEDMTRNAAGFREVSRSLGLQWPLPAEAEILLPAAIAALERADDDRTALSVIEAFEDLAANLTDAQAQQVVDRLLQRIGETNGRRVPLALALAIQALETDLTEAHAQQVLAQVMLARLPLSTARKARRKI